MDAAIQEGGLVPVPRRLTNLFDTLHVVENDPAYVMRRFLTPVESGDMQRDVLRVLCRPRPILCRCGAPIAAITARYRARVKARYKARMRSFLRKLRRRLPRS